MQKLIDKLIPDDNGGDITDQAPYSSPDDEASKEPVPAGFDRCCLVLAVLWVGDMAMAVLSES